MKYTDLATRLEDHDKAIGQNLKKRAVCGGRIHSLTRQLETAHQLSRKLRDEHTILIDSRDTTRREFNARLG